MRSSLKERGLDPNQTEAERREAVSRRFRFFRQEGGGIDAMCLDGVTKAHGDFVAVRAVTHADIYGQTEAKGAKRIHIPEQAKKADMGKVSAFGYEILSFGKQAKELRPDIEVGMMTDHLSSAADMVEAAGDSRCFHIPAEFLCMLYWPEDAQAWFDAKTERKEEAKRAEVAAREAAEKAIAEERARLVAEQNAA